MLLVIGLVIATAVNGYWFFSNFKQYRKNVKFFNEYLDAMRDLNEKSQQLNDDIKAGNEQVRAAIDRSKEVLEQAQKAAATYSVCKTCGRIVQGVCDICKG